MPKGQPALVPQPWPHKGWEYQELVVAYDGSWADALNAQGLDGWKLVLAIHDEDPTSEDREVRLLMERPLDKDWRPAEEKAVRVVKQRSKRGSKDALDKALAKIDKVIADEPDPTEDE